MTVRLLVAEDMAVVRGALVSLLEREPDFEVVAEVERGDLVLPAARRNEPDVALLDVTMPGQDGLSAANDLACAMPQVKVMILTESSCPGTFRAAMEAGVCGFVRKTADVRTLVDGIRSVAHGGQTFDTGLAVAAMRLGANPLRAREAELLGMLAEGATVGECARTLYLAPGTVRNCLRRAVDRLGARGRTDAIRIARQNGWI
ncbi:response regulator transcription factor [uncultured Cellulomonas sp.]|uniref:response regulator transcription factor n=1 Tax=uncultured Cellulomonas sp. TaxID=189682 RepID=UPI0028ED4DEB|nr:response regulator transcription factor [uncultured Cellulomonas sp.]